MELRKEVGNYPENFLEVRRSKELDEMIERIIRESNINNPTKIACIYARFSSSNQREESIEGQLRGIENYIKLNKIKVSKIFIDMAKSATTDRRPQFQQMIKESSMGIFDTIIVHKLDRFSRDKYDSAIYKQKLKQNGVKLISVLEKLDDSPESLIMESLLEGMAQYYSANLAREVMKGMKESAYNCRHLGGNTPFGYSVDENKKYVINEEEAKAVRIIFEMYIDGYSQMDIVNKINLMGLRTRYDKPFGKNSLTTILRNEKYSGVYIFNRSSKKDAFGKRNHHKAKPEDEIIRVEGGMPAIITKETFAKAQALMTSRKRGDASNKAKSLYLLSGLIKCGECGYSMVGNRRYNNKRQSLYESYRCTCRTKRGECNNLELKKQYIEEFVLDELQKKILHKSNIPILAKKLNEHLVNKTNNLKGEKDSLENEAISVQAQIDNIIVAISSGISSSSLIEKLKELEEKKESINVRLIELSQESTDELIITEEQIMMMFSKFREFVLTRNLPECKKLIADYVESVAIFRDHVEVVFNVVFSISDKNATYRKISKLSRIEIHEKYAN